MRREERGGDSACGASPQERRHSRTLAQPGLASVGTAHGLPGGSHGWSRSPVLRWGLWSRKHDVRPKEVLGSRRQAGTELLRGFGE